MTLTLMDLPRNTCTYIGFLQQGQKLTSNTPSMETSQVLLGLQSRTKLLEKVSPIMSTFLRNKTISKMTPLRKENPFPQFNVASHKRPGIRLSFEYTTTLLSGEGGEGRTGTAMMFRKMLSKYRIFSTVLSKIVACFYYHMNF